MLANGKQYIIAFIIGSIYGGFVIYFYMSIYSLTLCGELAKEIINTNETQQSVIMGRHENISFDFNFTSQEIINENEEKMYHKSNFVHFCHFFKKSLNENQNV